MPTVGVQSKITLATKEARTQIHDFYKAIVAKSSTVKTIVIQANHSGTLPLTDSDFLIIAGFDDVLEITLANTNGESMIFTNCGFLMVNSSNLSSVSILNNSEQNQEVTLVF